MSGLSQPERAELLLSLHHGSDPLLLPNVWDPIGALILAAKGYQAVATASAAVSASLGYQDGENISRSTLIQLLGRIAASVEVPVTADMEKGYGETASELERTIEQVIESGVVGINIEDGLVGGRGLREVDEQCSCAPERSGSFQPGKMPLPRGATGIPACDPEKVPQASLPVIRKRCHRHPCL